MVAGWVGNGAGQQAWHSFFVCTAREVSWMYQSRRLGNLEGQFQEPWSNRGSVGAGPPAAQVGRQESPGWGPLGLSLAGGEGAWA